MKGGEKYFTVWVFSSSDDSIPTGVGGEGGCLDGWMDERMNGRVAFEYLLLTDWRRPTWQAETGGSWGLRLAGAERGRERRVNYGWTDKVGGGGGGEGGVWRRLEPR